MTVINPKIENISENVGVMIVKLGTSNVHVAVNFSFQLIFFLTS